LTKISLKYIGNNPYENQQDMVWKFGITGQRKHTAVYKKNIFKCTVN